MGQKKVARLSRVLVGVVVAMVVPVAALVAQAQREPSAAAPKGRIQRRSTALSR
jgi:hypothetical protein